MKEGGKKLQVSCACLLYLMNCFRSQIKIDIVELFTLYMAYIV